VGGADLDDVFLEASDRGATRPRASPLYRLGQGRTTGVSSGRVPRIPSDGPRCGGPWAGGRGAVPRRRQFRVPAGIADRVLATTPASPGYGPALEVPRPARDRGSLPALRRVQGQSSEGDAWDRPVIAPACQAPLSMAWDSALLQPWTGHLPGRPESVVTPHVIVEPPRDSRLTQILKGRSKTSSRAFSGSASRPRQSPETTQ
jgi:hypothetical protein